MTEKKTWADIFAEAHKNAKTAPQKHKKAEPVQHEVSAEAKENFKKLLEKWKANKEKATKEENN